MRHGHSRAVPAPVPREGSQVGEAGALGLTQTPGSASTGGGPVQRCETHHAPSASLASRCLREPGIRSAAERRAWTFSGQRDAPKPSSAFALDLSQSIDTRLLYAYRCFVRAYALKAYCIKEGAVCR